MPFARIGIFETGGAPTGPIVELFRVAITARFAALEGFLGYQAFVEEAGRRYVGISYWTSIAALEASDDVAREAREDAAALGARVVGEPIIVEQAFDTR